MRRAVMQSAMYAGETMRRLGREQISIMPRPEELLKRRARELLEGLKSNLIRSGIDLVGRASPELPRGHAAWEEVKLLIRQQMEMSVPKTGRCWTHEDRSSERLRALLGVDE